MGHWTPKGIEPTDYDDDYDTNSVQIIKDHLHAAISLTGKCSAFLVKTNCVMCVNRIPQSLCF